MATASLHRISERRSCHRYPVDADLEYRVVDDCNGVEGVGATVDMSSSGILFHAPQTLATGSQIELYIAWPVRLNHNIELKFCVAGNTVRTHDGYTAVNVSRTEFRLRDIRTKI